MFRSLSREKKVTTNSATIFVNKETKTDSSFVSSGLQSWVYPSSEEAQLVSGIYMQVHPFRAELLGFNELSQEFAAWDIASDEAFWNFEEESL